MKCYEVKRAGGEAACRFQDVSYHASSGGSVANCAFRRLVSVPALPLTHLYLEMNRIREINSTSLSGLEQLQVLLYHQQGELQNNLLASGWIKFGNQSRIPVHAGRGCSDLKQEAEGSFSPVSNR
ncbi:toll-like receptor 5 [Lates japonicus]|uniref:Toll-like receptor 5 n=1 Tax=Lates japonicus TaxID=270547 RepID=A0AAD3M9N2_LATJO|nr:toll-like receptor 5 [Lates japonicus]